MRRGFDASRCEIDVYRGEAILVEGGTRGPEAEKEQETERAEVWQTAEVRKSRGAGVGGAKVAGTRGSGGARCTTRNTIGAPVATPAAMRLRKRKLTQTQDPWQSAGPEGRK